MLDLLFHGEKDLNGIHTVAEIMLTDVNGFFLDNLLLLLSTVRLETLLVTSAFTRVSALFVEGLVSISSTVLLLDYEVRSWAAVFWHFLHCIVYHVTVFLI